MAVAKSPFLIRLSFFLNYIVVRWQLPATLLVLWLAGLWLKSHYADDDSNLWLVMNQFLILIRWTLIGLFTLAVLFLFATWGFFVLGVRSKRVTIRLELGEGMHAEAGRVNVKVALYGVVVRPLLGTIRARLVFANQEWSEVIVLDANERKRGSLFRSAISGSGTTLLHHRGIYDVEKIHVSFSDMFNLLSLPYSMPVSQQLFTLPRSEKNGKAKAQPHAVEEQKYRIEVPKRVEGEYINYKEFESGDNIRRIVWKIYAKSGQLVVRVPETKDPYASHLYFYVSWYQSAELHAGIFETELLNIYKDKVRSIFEALQKNGYDVNIPTDQEVPRLAGMSEKKNELFQITSASWQSNNPPSTFVRPQKAAFVCLSSLTPAEELEQLIRLLPLSIPIVVIRLSDAIPSPFSFSIQHLFFRPESQPYDKLRQPWLLSPVRQKLRKNEAAVERLLNERGNGWLATKIDFSA